MGYESVECRGEIKICYASKKSTKKFLVGPGWYQKHMSTISTNMENLNSRIYAFKKRRIWGYDPHISEHIRIETYDCAYASAYAKSALKLYHVLQKTKLLPPPGYNESGFCIFSCLHCLQHAWERQASTQKKSNFDHYQ